MGQSGAILAALVAKIGPLCTHRPPSLALSQEKIRFETSLGPQAHAKMGPQTLPHPDKIRYSLSKIGQVSKPPAVREGLV
jgi:hypothetical protein